MSIKIPVQADFDSASVEQQLQAFQQKLNALGQQIARANKTQFNPVSKTSLQDMQRMVQQFEALRRVSGDLNKRINATGQKGRGFVDLDWSQLYPDAHSRNRQMAKAWGYVTGHAMAPPAAGGGGGGGGRHDGSSRTAPIWQQAAQAGLRASNSVTGGVGGVAANALGTGMSAGFGAGMMGLLGGVLALGVGKLVGAVTEKVKQAEDSSVAYDKLKRTLGDVNVSFTALKMAIGGTVRGMGGFATANHLGIGDAIAMVSRYSKTGGIGGGNIPGILSEVGAGIGMSRAYGLDPAAGVDVLSQARGVRFNRSEQDTRKFALLIGETIGRSGAFSKADEVMEAIGNYVVTQTRASHAANASGYAGMFSSMVGSGIPGLDPAGAAAMLGRINASLSGGGAKGEASQFFTTSLGARRGMDVFDTQLWREGGAFSTAGGTFGSGPVADFYRRHGLSVPAGDETVYGASMEEIKRQYGNNPKMMLQAMANHLGISMRNAAALDGLSPNQMGDLEGRLGRAGVNLKDVNMGGLNLLSRVVSGSGADRMSIAASLMGRTGKDKLNDEERKALDKVMRSGTLDEQKDLLTKLVASRDQEQTQGKDIRDSKVALENMKELMADKLIPLTQNVRDGVLYLAGGRNKSPESVMRDIEVASINDQIAEQKRIKSHIMSNRGGGRGFIPHENRDKISKEADEKIKELEAKRDAVEKGGVTLPESKPLGSAPEGWRSFDNPSAGQSAASLDAKLAAADAKYGLPPGTMKSIMKQEVGGRSAEFLADPAKYHYGLDASGRRVAPHTGKISTAFGPFGILESTAAKPGYGVSPLKDKGFDSQLDFAAAYAAARIKSAGSVRAGLAGYGEGTGYADSVTSRLPNGTAMPDDAMAAKRASDERSLALRGSFDPLAITIQSPDGKQLAPPHYLTPYFNRAMPFGQFAKSDPFGQVN